MALPWVSYDEQLSCVLNTSVVNICWKLKLKSENDMFFIRISSPIRPITLKNAFSSCWQPTSTPYPATCYAPEQSATKCTPRTTQAPLKIIYIQKDHNFCFIIWLQCVSSFLFCLQLLPVWPKLSCKTASPPRWAGPVGPAHPPFWWAAWTNTPRPRQNWPRQSRNVFGAPEMKKNAWTGHSLAI